MAINYNRGMNPRGDFITPRIATEMVRSHLSPLIGVTDVRKLYGGSTHRVLEFILDRPPGSIVAKANDADACSVFKAEFDALRYYRRCTRFPVPEPLALIESGAGFNGSVLLLQKIDGTNLEDAKLSQEGKGAFQIEFATAMVELHGNTATRFGPAVPDQTHDRWLDLFGPIAEQAIEAARGLLPSADRDVLDHVARHLDRWLDSDPTPTLIHGDLWANNIMVGDANPDQPRILAFIDGRAIYADPEYELAYLQLFGTAGRTFFDHYARTHRIDPGYQHRSRVYWLVTLLQHTKRYGERYLPQCERVIRELRRLAG